MFLVVTIGHIKKIFFFGRNFEWRIKLRWNMSYEYKKCVIILCKIIIALEP